MAIQRVQPKEVKQVRADEQQIQRSVQRGDWLTRGDKGDDVKALQRQLSAAGFYHGAVSGQFGPQTDAAVRAFQKSHHLVVDGAVGPQTTRALRQDNVRVQDNFGTAAQKGQAGRDILGVEKKLHALGYNTGKVDGVFDGQTLKAVRAFRKSDAQLPDNNSTIDARFAGELAKERTSVGGRAPRPAPATPAPAARGTVAEKLQQFDTHAPGNDYSKVNFRGVTVNKRTREMLERAEYVMQHKLGHKNFHIQMTQGSYHDGVSASAGTHDGGGVVDVHTRTLGKKTVDDLVKAMRTAGFAAWSRGRGADSFTPHMHAVALGDRQMSAEAKSQVVQYAHHQNGLSGHAHDPDAKLGRPVPDWAKRFV